MSHESCHFKMIYGICSVLDLIFKDDNSKSGLFTIVLYWMVDYCWLIIVTETLIVHDHNMLCLLVCQ